VQRKDKQKVIDEVWTEERVRGFLALEPPEGVNADFHRLQRAYQSMRAEDFAVFVSMFCEAQGEIGARGPEGQTLLEEISRHRQGAEFAEILREAGAH